MEHLETSLRAVQVIASSPREAASQAKQCGSIGKDHLERCDVQRVANAQRRLGMRTQTRSTDPRSVGGLEVDDHKRRTAPKDRSVSTRDHEVIDDDVVPRIATDGDALRGGNLIDHERGRWLRDRRRLHRSIRRPDRSGGDPQRVTLRECVRRYEEVPSLMRGHELIELELVNPFDEVGVQGAGSMRTRITVMLSLPPRSFARATSFFAATARSFSPATTVAISLSATILVSPSEHRT